MILLNKPCFIIDHTYTLWNKNKMYFQQYSATIKVNENFLKTKNFLTQMPIFWTTTCYIEQSIVGSNYYHLYSCQKMTTRDKFHYCLACSSLLFKICQSSRDKYEKSCTHKKKMSILLVLQITTLEDFHLPGMLQISRVKVTIRKRLAWFPQMRYQLKFKCYQIH